MLCAVPLLRALREHFPTAWITLIASPVNYEIMRNHPYLDEVLNYDKQLFIRSPWRAWRLIQRIRSSNFDLAVVPATVSVSVTSDLLACLSRARWRIGARSLQGRENPTSFCYTTSVDLDWNNNLGRHQTLRNLDVLQPLGICTDDLSHVMGLMDDERIEAKRSVQSLWSTRKILVGLHPGAGKPENRWPAVHFAHIANKLSAEMDAGIVITAGHMDDVPLEEFRQHVESGFLLIHNQPLRKVAAIISELDLFVTNDTGITHVAAATGTPVLALFGPTDARQWMPVGAKNRFISAENGKMDSISTDRVYELICEMLGGGNPTGVN